MKESVESKVGLFFALAVILALIVLEFLGSFGFLERGYHLHALFKNVQDLKTGDAVKMAGVRVGRVESIILSNSLADVKMNLSRNADVRTDSKAGVSFTGLMAQNFVDIGFGTPAAPRAEEGAILQTLEQPDMGQLFRRLDSVAAGVENLTRSFSGEEIDTLLGPLTDFVKDNRTNLTATISNIKTVSDRIEQGQGTVGKLLTDDTLYREATGSMTNLHEILRKINQGQGAVGQLINDDSFLKNAKLSLQKLDKATESLEDTGPLSILGTMVSSLF